MTVFKYFFKIMKEYKGTILLYTIILILFTGFNMTTSENNTNFLATKPDILLIDNDNSKLSTNIENYLKEYANLKDVKNNNDALFYRDVSLIIEIPKGYQKSVLNKNKKDIEIKSTKDAESEYGIMLIERYLKVSSIYENENLNENQLIEKINENIKTDVEIDIKTTLDTNALDKATFFYNFANYSLLAGCLFVISIILNSFKNNNIRKRTIISSYPNNKYNRNLFLAGTTYGVLLWILYTVIGIIILNDVMFTQNGILYLINSFIFMLCAVSISFLMGNLINDKEALNGIVNIVALGSTFLCGGFVPMQFLPDFVLKAAHILPSYWFIKNNEIIKEIEVININTIQEYSFNIMMIILFIILIFIATNIVSRIKRKAN